MALEASTWKDALEVKLKEIFTQMHSADDDDEKDDAWFAVQIAEAIASTGTDQIKTAGIPTGSVVVAVAGQATGTSNPNEITVV